MGINPAFTKKGDGRMCGAFLFSQKALRCTSITDRDTTPDHASLKKLEPPTVRGFGLEFEFVARKQANTIAGVKKCATKIRSKLTKRNLVHWNWEEDNSVTPLTADEAKSVGAPM